MGGWGQPDVTRALPLPLTEMPLPKDALPHVPLLSCFTIHRLGLRALILCSVDWRIKRCLNIKTSWSPDCLFLSTNSKTHSFSLGQSRKVFMQLGIKSLLMTQGTGGGVLSVKSQLWSSFLHVVPHPATLLCINSSSMGTATSYNSQAKWSASSYLLKLAQVRMIKTHFEL